MVRAGALTAPTPNPMQTLLPELLAEIFLHVWCTPSMEFTWGPLTSQMSDLLNILRVCSSWRMAALRTPALWCELRYRDSGTLPLAFYNMWISRAAAVPLDLNIWPAIGYGSNDYWKGATELLHTHCANIGALKLKLPIQRSPTSLSPLFPHPYYPASLQRLEVTPYDDFIHTTLANIPWSQLSHLKLRTDHSGRYISSTHTAILLSQAKNLAHLHIDLYPDIGPPASSKRLTLLNLHTLEISSLSVSLLDQLYLPSLKSLLIKAWAEGSEPLHQFILPVISALRDRSGFSLDSLTVHCRCDPIPGAFSSADLIALFQKMPSISMLHLECYDSDLSAFLAALKCSRGDTDNVLMPKLQSISLLIRSNYQLLPTFADLVASRWWPKAEDSHPHPVSRLQSFHLVTSDRGHSAGVEAEVTPTLSAQAVQENEGAMSRLTGFTDEGLRGLVNCQIQHLSLQLNIRTDSNMRGKRSRRGR
ncbi:hypothetical protein B0H10DRAFT_1978140 [Mycena sp. CBHHK59/15]|nr:hypothetical protein B0H10DRAFT_1978140 [Mycena sp. CBHHK59/15]